MSLKEEKTDGKSGMDAAEKYKRGDLEKLEDDLSDSLGEKATPAEAVAAPDGAKRVVKRVRKKPSTTTKGVTDKAEKKE